MTHHKLFRETHILIPHGSKDIYIDSRVIWNTDEDM